jgi:hypothetical protein
MRLQGCGVYAEVLAGAGVQEIGDAKLAKAKKPQASCPGLLGTRLAWGAEQRSGMVNRQDYRTGEKAAGISSLFACRIGRTPAWGGH